MVSLWSPSNGELSGGRKVFLLLVMILLCLYNTNHMSWFTVDCGLKEYICMQGNFYMDALCNVLKKPNIKLPIMISLHSLQDGPYLNHKMLTLFMV